MDSILQERRECFLCGRNGSQDPLDVHHCIHGANRKKSEKYGLKVYLCHDRCHINGVHKNAKKDYQMKRFAQIGAMQYYGWTEDEFRAIFGKSYLED